VINLLTVGALYVVERASLAGPGGRLIDRK
jgi:hypothetical protein